jgi:salicylate hydroxylase
MTKSNTVIVIGGGIGGLTTALALLKRGLDVEVYEQASRLGEVGAGIQISPNGTRVLYALGLAEALGAIQATPLRKELRHWRTGKTWNWYDLGATTNQRYGFPHVLLHRGDLHGILVDAVRSLKPDAIHLARRCVDVIQSDEHVEVRFETGETVPATFVIGADGIHSKIRESLFGPNRPEFTGCVAWRAVVPMQRLPAAVATMVSTNWLGPRGHLLHYPIRGGELMNFLSIVERDDWQVESWTVQGTTSELANDFPGWHPDVQTIIRNIDTPYKWALMVRGPMQQWSKGRVTLLGDACHPTLPFLGQGGVMAIEDAYVVAACLKKYFDDPEAAGARYEAVRKERTSAVVRKSHENRKQAFNPALAEQDEAVVSVAEEWQQSLARERLDWLYTYDATAIQI